MYGKDITMQKRYDIILDLIRDIKNPVGVEVGVWKGDTTFNLLNNKHDLILYCVDPYIQFKGDDDLSKFDDEYMDNLYNNVYNKLINNYKNGIMCRMSSEEASIKFKNENKQFDFVFIDGNHLDVEQDIEYWLPLLKDDGILIGHDYRHHKLGEYVKNVVDRRFGGKINISFDNTWWVYK